MVKNSQKSINPTVSELRTKLELANKKWMDLATERKIISDKRKDLQRRAVEVDKATKKAATIRDNLFLKYEKAQKTAEANKSPKKSKKNSK